MKARRNDASHVTRREREVWSLVAEHLSNSEIADRLHLSVRTVESHVSALIQKLQVVDRRQLARHRALNATASQWPASASSFIGREAERAALLGELGAHRMVSVVGSGGVGKTRLALETVQIFATTRRDGGRFVDLAKVSDPALVVPAIAAASDVAPPLGGRLLDALLASLANSDVVLLLDNCEHLIETVRDSVSRLLVACPKLSVVVTSRVPLRASFEWQFLVGGMSVDASGRGDAVELFLERARAAGVVAPLDRPRIARLCASLDGIALAIELAAARYRALGLDGLMAGLDHVLRMLDSSAGEQDRHRSLRNAIAWSYQLLSRSQQELLCTVSVFASWFDADAAVAVTHVGVQRFDVADALAQLAEHSLVLVDPGMPTRYRLLETIRQFGAEQLTLAELRLAVAGRHRAWCLASLDALAEQEKDDAWCEKLDRIAAEAHAALAGVSGCGAGAHDAAQIAERLAENLLLRGRPHDSQRCFERAANFAEEPVSRARLLRLAAGAAAAGLVGQEVLRLLDEAAAAALEAHDEGGAAEDLAWTAIYLRYAPGIIAAVYSESESEQRLERARSLAGGAVAAEAAIAVAAAFGQPKDDECGELFSRAIHLSREAGRPFIESVALDHRCAYHLAKGAFGKAADIARRRGSVLARHPLDAASAFQFNDHLLMAAEVHLAAGRLGEARECTDQLAKLACYRDYPHPALARRIPIDAMAGDFETAVARGRLFLEAWERAGRPVAGTLNVAAYAMAMVHGLLGQECDRSHWLDVAKMLTSDPMRLTTCETGWAPTFDALLALDRGDFEAALKRLSVDVDDPPSSGFALWAFPRWRPWYAALWAEASVLAGHPDAGARLDRAASAASENEIALTIVKRAGDLLRRDVAALVGYGSAFARLGCDYQRRRTEELIARARTFDWPS